MIPLQTRSIYSRVFPHINMGPAETVLLEKIMAGDEKGDDYEEALRVDRFFTETIVKSASAAMKTSVVKSLSHGVVLLGQEKIRNMVFGHTVDRLTIQNADGSFRGISEAAGSLKFALKAEEHARKAGNDYPGLAFAGGLAFDFFRAWAERDSKLGERVTAVIDYVWKHSLRTASLTWALTNHPRILISHRRQAFLAGLLHDFGKVVMACLEPERYLATFEKMKAAQSQDPTDDIYDISLEREEFNLTHPEVGSFVASLSKFLAEVESLVDFHHDFLLLKRRDANLFLLAVVVNIADRLAFLSETNTNFDESSVGPIMKAHKTHFPLPTNEVLSTYAAVKSKGLLTNL